MRTTAYGSTGMCSLRTVFSIINPSIRVCENAYVLNMNAEDDTSYVGIINYTVCVSAETPTVWLSG